MRTIKLLLIAASILITCNQSFAVKPKKIIVSQDAFVQGGASADVSMGSSVPDRLRINDSESSSDYARITFLQFNIKSLNTINEFEYVDLVINSMVYENKTDPNAQFELQIYYIKDDNWKENKITWNNMPQKDSLLGEIKITPSLDKKHSATTISLQKDLIKELIGESKDKKISLVLYNKYFNKTSCEILSKERLWSNGSPANGEAYLYFH